jgi:hypothetical protein
MLATWRTRRGEPIDRGVIEVLLEIDGSPKAIAVTRKVPGDQKVFVGVFDISFVSQGSVSVTLRREACASRLYTPTRSTHQVALLRPWVPVRFLLNGRIAASSGQYYV